MAAHVCKIERGSRRVSVRPLPQFRASCSCGWSTDWLAAAGLAHGAEAAHIERHA